MTARNVAKAIGYSPGTRYNLFEDLDDLVIHLNERTLDVLDAALSKAHVTGSPGNDLDRLLDLYLGFVQAHPNLCSVFDYRPASARAVPDWYLEKVARLLARLESALAPLFDAEGGEDRANAARVLWASLHGICSLAEADKLQVVTDRGVREMAQMLVRCFVSELATRSAGSPPGGAAVQ